MTKIYTSTRNKNIASAPKQAILEGIAKDGGLYVYDELDAIKLPLKEMMEMNYASMAKTVLQALLPDFSEEEVADCVVKAYEGKFESNDITPLYIANGVPILELFHGPTCAFKDVGLRMLPQLMSKSLNVTGDANVMILTATSGDTGKAALEGFRDVNNIGITVFYPNNGVSNMQRLQMVTQEGVNTCVCAIEGNFDDAQSNVKKIFQDRTLANELAKENVYLSSANSINIGRLIPQIVYYFYAYKEMIKQGQIAFMDEVNFCVPTGNYGNVLAGYYAKCMGLPVHKFIVASNSNNVLYDFMKDGTYDRQRPFYKTISPSMDILISSNLERLLYYKSGKNAEYIQGLMKQLEEDGSYQVRDEILNSIKQDFYGGYCDDQACAQAMRSFYKESGYVLDPHTAVGYKVMKEYEAMDSSCKTILLSTASPYKFAAEVQTAIFGNANEDEFASMEELEKATGMKIPASLAALKVKKVRHTALIDRREMKDFVKEIVKEKFHD